MVATSQRARLQAAAAELEPSLAAELLAKLAARCFDATPTAASGRRLSVVGRRSSPSGASQARRASGMVAGQAASPAPVTKPSRRTSSPVASASGRARPATASSRLRSSVTPVRRLPKSARWNSRGLAAPSEALRVRRTP